MNTANLGERLLYLRKNKGITQENLAKELGITNQAVSKWESGQCCPDIDLIPEIARFYSISVGELLGVDETDTEDDLIVHIKNELDKKKDSDKYGEILKIAKALHAVMCVEESKKGASGLPPKMDSDETIEHAMNDEWGISVISEPKIRTSMRGGSVFFSGSQRLFMDGDIPKLSKVLKSFADRWVLSVFFAIYELTGMDETTYVGCEKIVESTDIPEENVTKIIGEDLKRFLDVNGDKEVRIKDEYMNIAPVLSLLVPIL